MDIKIQNALISVSDKINLEQLAFFLRKHGVTIYATGSTYKHLENMQVF